MHWQGEFIRSGRRVQTLWVQNKLPGIGGRPEMIASGIGSLHHWASTQVLGVLLVLRKIILENVLYRTKDKHKIFL